MYEPYYHILGFYAANVHEYQDDNSYTITLFYTMRHKNDGRPEDAGYIQWAKENRPEEYPSLYKDYNKEQGGTMGLKIVAAIQEDGTLDMDYCEIYTEEEGARRVAAWSQIPSLAVFVGNGNTDMPGWSEE